MLNCLNEDTVEQSELVLAEFVYSLVGSFLTVSIYI